MTNNIISVRQRDIFPRSSQCLPISRQAVRALDKQEEVVVTGGRREGFWFAPFLCQTCTRIYSSHLRGIIIFARLFSLPPSRNSDPRSHIAGPSPPSQLQFMSFVFIARRLQPFLPTSTRVEYLLSYEYHNSRRFVDMSACRFHGFT